MREDDQDWSWVGEDGTEHAADESQLSFALSSEELPAYTLVCKKGWAEWLPAMQVAELQWALPAGRADQPRKPAVGHKPKPPLERYPALKKRAREIARGLASETSQHAPAKPRDEKSSPVAVRAPTYSLADMDEPTLQIDADALDDAFERLQTSDPSIAVRNRTPRSAPTQPRPDPPRVTPAQATPSASQPQPPSAPKAAPPPSAPTVQPPSATRAPLPSAPQVPPPSAPTARPPPPSTAPLTSAPILLGSTAPTPTPAPVAAPTPPEFTRAAPPLTAPPLTAPPLTAPPGAFAPVPRGQLASAPGFPGTPVPGAARPWLDSQPATQLPFEPAVRSTMGESPILTPLPYPPSRNKWPWVLLGVVGAASAVGYWLSTTPEPEPEAVPTAAPAPEPEPPKPVLMQCAVTTTPIAIAGWAHPSVRPVLTKAPGIRRVAVGYAQTSKLATGLVLDTKTLNAEKPFSNSQNSPLLSVVPATRGMGQELSFLESRAASTLQSAIFVPAQPPFAVGLSQGGIAVRRENETDALLWKPQWETISVPTTTRLEAGRHAIVVRAGGERGSMLLGKLDERGRPDGELQELAPGTDRLGMPSITTSEGKVVVAFDAAPRGTQGKHAYLGVATAPDTPLRAEPTLKFDGPVTSVGAAALKHDGYFVQYTRGEVAEQRVMARVLDAQLQPVSDEIPVSPAGKDAYNGELYYEEDQIVVVYMVRSGLNHEFWATALSCNPR